MSTEQIWFQGRFWPLMAGGNGEEGGTGGGEYADDGGGVMSDQASTDAAAPEAVPEAEQPQPEAQPAAPASSALSQLGQQAGQAQPQQYQPAPQPQQVLQQRMQELQLAHAMEERQLQTELQFLPQDQAQLRQLQFAEATLNRRAAAMQLQGEMQRAQLEPVAKEAAIDRLVEAARSDNPGIDAKAMRAELAAWGAHGAGAVLTAAQRYADSHRAEALQARAKAGTDKMGSGAPMTANSLKGKSTTELLSMGIKELERSGRRR